MCASRLEERRRAQYFYSATRRCCTYAAAGSVDRGGCDWSALGLTIPLQPQAGGGARGGNQNRAQFMTTEWTLAPTLLGCVILSLLIALFRRSLLLPAVCPPMLFIIVCDVSKNKFSTRARVKRFVVTCEKSGVCCYFPRGSCCAFDVNGGPVRERHRERKTRDGH